MEIEVEREELAAVHKWNSAQFANLKDRVRKLKTFSEWRRVAMQAHAGRREEQILRNRELAAKSRESPAAVGMARSNDQLRRELEILQREQRELERRTGQIREELRGLQGSTHGFSVFS
jgi:predicted  nucleic acid-binding Zn-ribbon protein